MDMVELSKVEIRKRARAARRALSEEQQGTAARALARRALRSQSLMSAQRIACYLADDGEPDLIFAMESLHALGKDIYLPVIYPGRRSFCRFAKWSPYAPMINGKFDIPIPEKGFAAGINAQRLDVVLMPLVAFDDNGNRLGRGGGFYDRSLEFLRYRQHWKQPKLIGIAHACQRVERIPMDEWDIATDGMIVV